LGKNRIIIVNVVT